MNRTPRLWAFLVVVIVGAVSIAAQVSALASLQGSPVAVAAASYSPARSEWQTRRPSEVGMDEALLAQVIETAKTRDSAFGRTDYAADQLRTFGRPLGPVPASRGGTNGIIIKNGYIVAEFGDTSVVEPTYSVAKSYLSTVLGLTIDRGMIKSVTDPVRNYIKDGGYDSPHNARITWEHHARQTSEWEGTMFGKPSTFLGTEEFGNGQMKPRAIREPGTYYEYNDVRVNRFSLSMMRLWKRSIGDVLKTEIMDPIGASDTWKWIGYDNADVDVEGRLIRSVPGGTRWGGGIWMNTRDHARFGLLMARNGKWNGKQLVSESWIKQATTVGGAPNSPDYGYLWWLNTKGANRGVPTTSYRASGNGGHSIFVDPEHDLVAVFRWSAAADHARIVAAIKPKS
jgi:CubicO group peptidase (beta-lactamase class C family)